MSSQEETGTPAPLTASHPYVVNMRRRLERWELAHLRRLAADQGDRIDALQIDLENEKSRADYWYDQCMEMIEELQEAGKQIGLTKAGDILVAQGGAA